MRGRLFWKILLGFWVTFILMTQMLWLVFSFYGNRHEPPEREMVRRIAKLQVASAASVLQSGGLPALNAMTANWSETDKSHFSVLPVAQIPPVTALSSDKVQPPKGRDPEFYSREVTTWTQSLDGQNYRISYDIDGLRDVNQRGGGGESRREILNIPIPMIWMGVLGGLFFSTLLAWNLTRPMRQLRAGFERVAQGDLSVRLLPVMRRRHDELTEVARDFDSMAERLEELVSAREQLLHDVSHELRSPLARLQLAIGLARQNPDNVENSLQRIEHESERLDKMIGELLALSRAENHNIAEDDEYFDLRELVTVVVNDARYEAQVPGVEILLQVSPQVDYTVKGNAELMRRAIDNIVRNALRFSTHGQQVKVLLSQVDKSYQIQVSDQGPGVDESKLSSIFDPFVRVKSAMLGKGYGLGLAITRKVILAHGGQVEARNGEQGGLVITLRVPRWITAD
ncbi:sensor histidine kinase [Yersinia enterocolitica]|uniref:histidine kinase n=1 Tax=Yersinia enterocolitica serotype O:8 / biotype 1B (strain NCTC 13174 / 8081) TaxID=393305 RepID=A1JL81_YERE8|nr:ATP-binding protein [Yersinia enterocolitica]AJJ25311.1 HAMP domain protein [Yersinia enterocolitica]CAL11295.1 putative two-component system sensor kinase [Yersinia enterocolitica subsp. enterocolitica 8081]CNG64389.1 putative two-component system sensor kinase [Yersinia enterocolitica]CRY29285.1 putative two-component system sensor kinase [Yersinia enterocolitica]HDL8282637.1 HAMP domain-containing protein [Yersinia enterocolitica]